MYIVVYFIFYVKLWFFFLIDVFKELCVYLMDVVFVLDGLDSVICVNFDKVKKFILDIIDEFDLLLVKVWVGVIEFFIFIGRVIEFG